MAQINEDPAVGDDGASENLSSKIEFAENNQTESLPQGRVDQPAKAASYWDPPGWREAARQYHADRPALGGGTARERPTPQTTIEAIMYCVRTRGIAALKEPANIERLSRCDAEAKAQIDRRIAKMISNKDSAS